MGHKKKTFICRFRKEGITSRVKDPHLNIFWHILNNSKHLLMILICCRGDYEKYHEKLLCGVKMSFHQARKFKFAGIGHEQIQRY